MDKVDSIAIVVGLVTVFGGLGWFVYDYVVYMLSSYMPSFNVGF